MYSNKVIAAKAALIESSLPIKLKEHSIDEVDRWVEHFKTLVHPDSTAMNPKRVRNLNEQENLFATNEVMMCKISYRYWATRYAFIKQDKGGLARLKFWESQEMLMDTISTLEEAKKPMLLINLKARQVGSSTLSESILTHKAIYGTGTTSIVASDTPEKSEFLFNMMERICNNLPSYLQPSRKFHVKGSQLFFDTQDSLIQVDSGNKRSGGIGQGVTVHSGHLSELATWDNVEQITQDLIPAVISGSSPNTFFIMESTANGKQGFWYESWRDAKRKRFYGFIPVFIPWWAIKEKYATEPDLGWGPSERVMRLAMTIKSEKGVDLNRKQMFWWEQMYESYKAKDRLHEFFAEYASDDQEAFQLSGKTVFSTEKLNDLIRIAKTQTMNLFELQEKTVYK
jgi:hypothetical protein